MKERILITLATGKTGYLITQLLLREGYLVRIYVRSRNKRALELEKLGAEIAIGEFDDYEQFKSALNGVQKAYFCYPMAKGLLDSIALFAKAARETNLQALVFMGQWLAEFSDAPSLMTKDIQRAYKLLEDSGLNVVYFNPGFFADNLVPFTLNIVQLGKMPSPFGDGKCPWVSTGDLARCVVALLKNPEPYFGKKVHPTGPKSIDAKEMVAVYSKVSGRKVAVMPIPDSIFLKAVIGASAQFGYADNFLAVHTVLYVQEFRKNRFGEPNNVVKELTGREPEDFETIVKQILSSSPYGKRSFSNKWTAIKGFINLLFTKSPSKKEIEELNTY